MHCLEFFAFCCSILTFFMSILHGLLLVGAPLGEYVLGGKNKIIPKEKRYINIIFFGVFLLIGLFYLQKAAIISVAINALCSRIVMILYSAFLGYAIIGNIFFTNSRKEKILMLPASVIGFVCSLLTLLLSW